MLKVELLISLGGFALWLFCLIDVVGTDTGRVRNLPKLWWLLIVLFFPFIG
ncbi:MAG: PLDc N-terminal domain-containing protein, partial [Nocardioides sp.]|nr:PLDc N-terminal domain-containing protein [Nocardioides sp.]